MLQRSWLVFSLCVLLLSTGEQAVAETRFSPSVELLKLRAQSAQKRGLPHADPMHATLRLKGGFTESVRMDLESLGLSFYWVEGRVLRRGSLVPARIPLAAFAALRQRADIEYVDAHPRPLPPKFDDLAQQSTELLPAWQGRDASGQFLTGRGVVVGNIDADIDVFHPEFFQADGGRYDWMDVNLDYQFTPGIDRLVLEPGSDPVVIQFVDNGIVVDPASFQPNMPPPPSDGYQVDIDWLYVDLNENGKRDYGLAHGFTEETPAYGEPLFIVDDIDRNGQLDPGEKLIRLKTSKIRAIYRPSQNLLRRRGVDLIKVPQPVERSHGTMTVGVLAGGHWSRPYRGVAPDVDIVHVDYLDEEGGGGASSPTTAGLIWLQSEGVDIVMHEYGAPIGMFGDGSSDHEILMDEMHNQGIPQCTATHNFAGYPGHDVVDLPPEGQTSVKAEVGGFFGESLIHYWTLRWREPVGEVGLKLILPEGELALGKEPQDMTSGDHAVSYTGVSMSSRGTQMAVLFVGRVGPDGNWQPLMPATYQIALTSLDGTGGEVDVWLNDENGYLIGSALTKTTTKGTLAYPSTADSAIGTGALSANVDMGSPLGDLTFYSGQGPRIDGALGIDVVAPADGLAADSGSPWAVFPSMTLASGTSGSLPQVTGVVALLKQLEPDISADQVTERLQAGALEDGFTDVVPNDMWGYGKLSAYGTLFQTAAPWNNNPPVVSVAAPEILELGEELVLSAAESIDPDHDSDVLKVRWDVGYDGVWTEATPLDATLSLPGLLEPGVQRVVVEVYDPLGAFQRRLITVEYVEEVLIPEPQPEAENDIGSDDSVSPELDADAGPVDKDGSSLTIPGNKTEPKDAQGCGGCMVAGARLPLELLIVSMFYLGWFRRRRA
jgi:subtilisin family serine protease